jgi:hypothetical protein
MKNCDGALRGWERSPLFVGLVRRAALLLRLRRFRFEGGGFTSFAFLLCFERLLFFRDFERFARVELRLEFAAASILLVAAICAGLRRFFFFAMERPM